MNDFLWFEEEMIFEHLGIKTSEDDGEDEDEEDEEDDIIDLLTIEEDTGSHGEEDESEVKMLRRYD